MQSKIPLYPYGAKEARERGEIEKWRESFRENCACAGGIDILIRENFDGMHLKDGTVEKIVEVLQGHGCPDLTGVCITLAANMLHLCNGWPIEEATKQAQKAISSGRAFEQMKRWIAAQGGDAAVLDNVGLLPQASVQYELKAPQAGYIHHMDAQKIGESSAILGAGRKTKDDVIDPAAGIVLKEKTGAKVEQGGGFCASCGSQLPPGAKFCPSCGTPR